MVVNESRRAAFRSLASIHGGGECAHTVMQATTMLAKLATTFATCGMVDAILIKNFSRPAEVVVEVLVVWVREGGFRLRGGRLVIELLPTCTRCVGGGVMAR